MGLCMMKPPQRQINSTPCSRGDPDGSKQRFFNYIMGSKVET